MDDNWKHVTNVEWRCARCQEWVDWRQVKQYGTYTGARGTCACFGLEWRLRGTQIEVSDEDFQPYSAA